ncbi:MAG: 2-oxoacid:acceptor oxidoreductase family protein [Deltaproteobacteria bacterium]|nr:2-oxoacid:acceptor oxidoreductase family protein [Deltaproteobacteria bacterium]
MHESVIMSGFGGQGILLMGQLLCSAGMHEGLKVTWMPSYGPEMRGGTANCTVMLSSDRIGSPVTHNPSSLVAMNKPSLDRFEATIQMGGFLVINSSLVDRDCQRSDLQVVKIPANKIAEEAGTLQVTNMAALGAYIGGKRVVSLESVILALRRMIPEHRKELLVVNEKALRRGAEEAAGQI